MLAEATELVGRRDEVATIERALRGLVAGESGVVEISGEPGIGKSRLISEACDRAERVHALVLAGRAAEFESDAPFGVLVDALDDYLGTLNPRRIERLGPETARELAQVFPSLAEFADDAGTPSSERFRSHRAVRLLLEALAGPAPLLLALDDLHWADEASLELVSHLLRKPTRAPVLLVVAYRAGQAPRRLVGALRSAASDGLCRRIEPGPLTAAEADELLSGHDAAARAVLYEESGGNPFYLEQLARDTTGPRTFAAAVAPAAAPGTVPASVMAALDDEIDALADESRGALLAAAVAGEPFDPGIVEAVAELNADAMRSALDELLAADLVRATAVPMRFRFRHPIVRHAVYEHAGAGWRIGAHARAAAALATAGAGATQRAHHVERSAAPGDDAAIRVLVEAAHASATRAPATAAGWFAAALRLLPSGSESDGRRLELLVPLATALGASGQLGAARETVEDLRTLIPPSLGAARAQVTILRAQIDLLLGDFGKGRALLHEALDEHGDADPAIASDLKIGLSSDRFMAGDWEGVYKWARLAYDDIAAGGDLVVRASTGSQLAGAAYLTSRIDEATALVDEAAAIVDSLPDDQVAARLTSLHWVGWCEEYLERYDASIAHLERGLGIARATGQGARIVGVITALSSALVWRGRLARAEHQVEEATEAALLSGNDQFVVWALQVQARVAQLRGDIRGAIRLAEQAVALSLGDPLTLVASCNLGEALIEAGEHAAGRDAILAGVGGAAMPVIEKGSNPRWCETLTRADLALGREREAEGWVLLAESAVAACPGLEGRRSEALRARAELELARGQSRAAADAAGRAVAAAATIAAPIQLAKSQMLAGRALVAAGDVAAATAAFESARSTFGATGAERLRDAAARELRKLGRRVPRSGAARRTAPGDALSVRERQIAELVTVGKTNRQIAAELFLSEKTVETHLSHVFAKLGVASRAAVAGSLGREAR